MFFVTGRREAARDPTAANLRAAGYRGGWTLKMRPDEQPRRWRDGWKARVRRAIVERHDFRILANLGDQWSDLDERLRRPAVQAPEPDVRDPDRLSVRGPVDCRPGRDGARKPAKRARLAGGCPFLGRGRCTTRQTALDDVAVGRCPYARVPPLAPATVQGRR